MPVNFAHILQRPEQGPGFLKVRHEPKVRSLTVRRVERITPAMVRVVLVGRDLDDFASSGFDDHIKIIVPTERGTEARDYTPRRFDPSSRELTIDFAVHEAGPATAWATRAKAGDRLDVAGPKKPPEHVRRWLLIGDETALPAIGRFIEEADNDTDITSVIAVASAKEEQRFRSRARVTTLWAHRPLAEADRPGAIVERLHDIVVAPDTFVWIAAEARVARHLRCYLSEFHDQPVGWMKAGGYWVRGQSDAHERIG